MKSDVYFVKLENNSLQSRRIALLKLLEAVQPLMQYKNNEFVPIKITIGDGECVYHIDPELAKIAANSIKDRSTKPFLFDTNVIYRGSRQNAVDHMALALNKRFSHAKLGAPFIIADGLFGQDGKTYDITSDHIKRVKVPSFIGMVDSLVVLSHVTSHILSGFAGSIKNVSMGMVSKATKQAQHSSLKPQIIPKKCTGCKCCIKICPANAISYMEDASKAMIHPDKCIGCGECLCACKFDAILINWKEDVNIFLKRLADVSKFVLSKFKNTLFINFAFDITLECDCISGKDEPIICKDIGILASKDILSVDKATLDLINADEDVINKKRPGSPYGLLFEYSHEIGLGNLGYNLIKI